MEKSQFSTKICYRRGSVFVKQNLAEHFTGKGLFPTVGQKISLVGENFGLWKRDVTTDRFTAHPGRGSTVGGGGSCAANTEVSKNFDVGRNDMTVVPGKVVVGHMMMLT